MDLPLIIACSAIVLVLIIFPLVVSYKAEKKNGIDSHKPATPKTEWNKIKEYGKQINKKTRDNK
ncbi:hypothetical protein N9N34_00140 [Candidatus Pelagibacter bacterium]|nr:hypothetical protein [Candidatus Pelagibacter bacterium]